MPSTAQDLVGCEVFSHDGDKIGKIRDVIGDSESLSEYVVVVKHPLHRDLVVPASVLQRQGDDVRVPFASSYLNDAPSVAAKGKLSREEKARLEHFYYRRVHLRGCGI